MIRHCCCTLLFLRTSRACRYCAQCFHSVQEQMLVKQISDSHICSTSDVYVPLQVDVNGPGAHPVWRFLIANQPSHHGYPAVRGSEQTVFTEATSPRFADHCHYDPA